MKKSYDIIDLCKWICAWLVVCIHVHPFSPQDSIFNVVLVQGIARIAVPFFFSVSMFFLFEKLKNTRNHAKTLFHFLINFIKLYLLWALIYYAYHIFYRFYNGIDYTYTFFGVILDFFARGVHTHLWYLIATIYALPIVYLLWRAGRIPLIITCLSLHILQCLDAPYHLASIFDHPAIAFYQEEYNLIARTILHAVPLMALGIICQMDFEKRSHEQWKKLLIVSLVVFFIELTILLLIQGRNLKMERSFTSIFLIYCFTNWSFGLDFHFARKWIGKALRISSLWIYCVHPLIRELYYQLFAYEGLVRFAVISFVTLCSSILYTAIKFYLDHRRDLSQQSKVNISF